MEWLGREVGLKGEQFLSLHGDNLSLIYINLLNEQQSPQLIAKLYTIQLPLLIDRRFSEA